MRLIRIHNYSDVSGRTINFQFPSSAFVKVNFNIDLCYIQVSPLNTCLYPYFWNNCSSIILVFSLDFLDMGFKYQESSRVVLNCEASNDSHLGESFAVGSEQAALKCLWRGMDGGRHGSRIWIAQSDIHKSVYAEKSSGVQ